MIVLFARANHPRGYGYLDGRAHGYVVVGFRCKDRREVKRVTDHVQAHGIDLPDEGRIIFDKKLLEPFGTTEHYKDIGYPGVIRWYSGGPGDWDYLCVMSGNKFEGVPTYGSRGDNRFFWIYDAGELLRSD